MDAFTVAKDEPGVSADDMAAVIELLQELKAAALLGLTVALSLSVNSVENIFVSDGQFNNILNVRTFFCSIPIPVVVSNSNPSVDEM